ncbi:MAG: dihydroorotase [Candidatus Omnitrophica bacterium]|jgi:dihydroorotase|nr:dihydroorotase [Candidatus Omnitrophota bacterium]
MKTIIKNARVVDPANNLDAIVDLAIENGKISKIGNDLRVNGSQLIDAKDKIVIPGIVDMHVHLREPGREDKETVFSGTRAAVKGGVTSLLAMPNTTPAIDSPENVSLLNSIIKRSAQCNVFISGTITKERAGKQASDVSGLKKAGAIAITDDGASVDDDKIFMQALEKAARENILVIAHCEDKALSKGGVVNLGFISTKLGLRGIPKESEYSRVERDIILAQKAKAAIHIAHVSCKESVDIIAQAKNNGIQVTCETAPHYFALSEEDVAGYDTNMKMNPPLRAKEDLAAIREGLRSGIIDAIASDHAPHTENEKDIEFERAEFGKIGLESGLVVCIQQLIGKGILDWKALVEKIALNPARILGINKGTLGIGRDADLVIIDPKKEMILAKEGILSKSKNSPFIGRKFIGSVERTILAGQIVYEGANK